MDIKQYAEMIVKSTFGPQQHIDDLKPLAKAYLDLEKRYAASMEVVKAAKIECQRLNESGMTTLYFPLMKALEKFESASG